MRLLPYQVRQVNKENPGLPVRPLPDLLVSRVQPAQRLQFRDLREIKGLQENAERQASRECRGLRAHREYKALRGNAVRRANQDYKAPRGSKEYKVPQERLLRFRVLPVQKVTPERLLPCQAPPGQPAQLL